MLKRSSRQVRIEQAIHRSTPEQLLLQAVLHPGSSRHLIDRELDRRALGDLPPGLGREMDPAAEAPQYLAAA